MNKTDMAAIITGLVAVVAAAVVPTYIVSANATERERICVENGGAYVLVANTSKMECRK